MRKKFFKKAQSTAEYAILFGLIIGAVVAMQTYLKRGVQAKLADSTDYLTDVKGDVTGLGDNLNQTGQYEPYYMKLKTSDSDRDQRSDKKEEVFNNEERKVSETMNATVNAYEVEKDDIIND